MPLFEFEGMDAGGANVRDTVEAVDEAGAAAKCRSQGYFVTKLRLLPETSNCPACGRVTRADADRCEHCGRSLSAPERAELGEPTDSELDPDSSLSSERFRELENGVLGLLQGGRKIAAVKLCCDEAGLDLKEAKDFVEAVARKHKVEAARGSGCAGALLLLLVLVGGLAILAT